MPSTLSISAVEKSTIVITAAFTDEDGDAATPATLTWTLTDSEGNIINSRNQVVVSSPTSSEDIVLHGDDLAVTESGDTIRILTIEGTYNSSLGAGLELKDSVRFELENLVAIS